MAEALNGYFQPGAEMTSSQSIGQGAEWVLKRYERLGMPGSVTQMKVFESNEESGSITLTIVNTGHFLICQGHTLLEGFSLNSAKTWLKIGKKSDRLLFGSKTQDESRMFRVQFKGESMEKALENCDICFQKLQCYLGDQNEASRESIQSFPYQRIGVTQVAQSLLKEKMTCLGGTQDVSFSTGDLGQFIKLCLLDQHFPAFVEAVEKELHKLTEN
ncbi:meiotic recombination protein REC114 [Mantella aurantiaca]